MRTRLERDSKSREAQVSCGFDSHLRHQCLSKYARFELLLVGANIPTTKTVAIPGQAPRYGTPPGAPQVESQDVVEIR